MNINKIIDYAIKIYKINDNNFNYVFLKCEEILSNKKNEIQTNQYNLIYNIMKNIPDKIITKDIFISILQKFSNTQLEIILLHLSELNNIII